MAKLDFWFDFSSSYSYLAAMRITELAQEADVEVTWRVFLLGPIFKAQGLASSPFTLFPEKGRYALHDLTRLSAARGLAPFKLPDSFPTSSVLAARVFLIAQGEGWGIDFAKAVFTAEFTEGADISSVDLMSGILGSLGQDAEAVLTSAVSDDNKAVLRKNTEEAQGLGIFGAPTFVTTDDELFWGDDRLQMALEAAKTR